MTFGKTDDQLRAIREREVSELIARATLPEFVFTLIPRTQELGKANKGIRRLKARNDRLQKAQNRRKNYERRTNVARSDCS